MLPAMAVRMTTLADRTTAKGAWYDRFNLFRVILITNPHIANWKGIQQVFQSPVASNLRRIKQPSRYQKLANSTGR